SWTVAGRGVLHLGILVETLRREGYELAVGRPRVIFKQVDGERHEPIETVIVDCAEKFSGKMIEILGGRRGELHHMDRKGDFVHMEFRCPSRGLIGLRTQILASAGGEAIFYHQFHAYEPYKGPIAGRGRGVIIASESGSVTNYALNQLADRGMFFVAGGDEVYEGQIVGENCKEEDIRVNICKEKHLTNVRAASADKKIVITPPRRFQLEEALEYLEDDELLEVTPRSLRLRKILLKEIDRKRARRAEKI
ncbi:MAG: translational GTPase TypA, partial [Planctomycetes bacterium]|nr:translational GTPase TypA [Planctomycetota bacterium]